MLAARPGRVACFGWDVIKIKSQKGNRARNRFVIAVVMVMFCALSLQLYNLQIVQGESYTELVEEKKTKTKTVVGQRGSILDANGIPLATDQKCYNVCFYRDPNRKSDEDREAYTQVLLKVIDIVEANGGETIDEFWLTRDETTGEWIFDTGTSLASAAAKREEQWRANFALQYTPLDKLFDTLCNNYSIPDDLTEEEKIQVLALWQESRMKNFLAEPVTIAYSVNLKTVAEIEALTSELDGISIEESTTRVYPRGSLASHVIGYVGAISSETALAEYQEKGYSSDAKVGITGIEYSMEDQLTPNISYRQGTRVVEVNSLGKVIRELSYEEPIDGNSVMLTLDTRLQSVLETALKENIEIINQEQQELYESESWQNKNAKKLEALDGKELQFAETGAAVVMDPNSGAVLAMASYPDYDLNWFVSGTDNDKIQEVMTDERSPMFNRAISAKDTPGSIFKMCTALAALMEGAVTPDEKIDDMGAFTGLDTTHQPKCWIYPNYASHSNQDVVAAIKNSCNYYFYTVGLRLGSTNLSKWAARLGLTSKTGIELPSEATSFVGNQSTLYDSDRAISDQNTSKPQYAANRIKALLRTVGEDMQITYDEDRLDRVAKELLDIVNEEATKSTWPARIRTILLQEMNLTNEYIAKRALGTTIQSYLNDLKWTDSETIMCAIGQSITQVTPIAVARYISALANGGTVYDAQIIDKIISPTGEVILDKQPVVASTIDDTSGFLEYIKSGMHSVTSVEDGGTAAKYYEDSKYKDVICAKTGTAQTTSLIDLENKSWHVAFAPIDDPQIVVVVYIPNGYAGGLSAYTCRTVIDYYLDRENLVTQDIVPDAGALAP